MSRLRADDVLNRAGTGAVNASEGLTVPAAKSITFTDASEPTVLDGTSLTTTTLNVDQLNIGYNNSTPPTLAARFGLNQELTVYQNDFASVIQSDKLIIRAKQGLEDPYITCTRDGSVELTYSGTAKFETTASGIAVAGETTSTSGWAGTTSSANVLGGLAMPFTCGLNGRIALPPTNATMLFGGSEYNGDNTEGATMPHAGKLVAATLHAENAVGDLQLRATLNGVQDSSYAMSFSSPTPSSPSVVQTFYSSPMTFAAGDRVNFGVFLTSLTQLEVLTVTFFVKFD